MVDVKQVDHEAIASILDAGGFTLTGSDMRQPDSPRTPVEMAALMALATQREAYEARIAELERELRSWKSRHAYILDEKREDESRLASYDALVEALEHISTAYVIRCYSGAPHVSASVRDIAADALKKVGR